MAFKIYNTLKRNKEEFQPLTPPFVSMYVCGPTVYGHSHLGHARSYITSDILYRFLSYKGLQVRYVQNITDVGHLVGDRDAGDDKIQKQARLEKQDPQMIAYKYEVSYFEDMDRLNILRPSVSCRATGHIPEMIDMIDILLKKGFAYSTPDENIYFDVRKFESYGKLSGRKLEEAQEGERIENAHDKKHVEDFALWKKADPSHLMQWNSPWGRGYPGWHIECSVMAQKYLGETIDIHCGGIENTFPHHECEIAQSEAANGKEFVRYFIHHNMLTVNGTKMGKSLGNFIILKDLYKKFEPMVLRFYILQCHYRSPLDFTDEAMNASKAGYERLKNSIFTLKKTLETHKNAAAASSEDLDKLRKEFLDAMDDDMNTPVAISVLYEILKMSNIELARTDKNIPLLKAIEDTVTSFFIGILGFTLDESGTGTGQEDRLIDFLISLRNQYRAEKNFKMSDTIRDSLKEMGIILKDGPEGTTYVR
jgi:cysteinyl-tRNA synthetase